MAARKLSEPAATVPATGPTGRQHLISENASATARYWRIPAANRPSCRSGSVPPGQSAMAPLSGGPTCSTSLPSGSIPRDSLGPGRPITSSKPPPHPSSSYPCPCVSDPPTGVPSGKTPTAAVSPQKPKPKADHSRQRKPLEEDMPTTVAKAPPPPQHPRITSFREAKSAYASHAITAGEYRMIVEKLKTEYAREVEQLKLDYRSGRVDKTEYARRAADIKTRYK